MVPLSFVSLGVVRSEQDRGATDKEEEDEDKEEEDEDEEEEDDEEDEKEGEDKEGELIDTYNTHKTKNKKAAARTGDGILLANCQRDDYWIIITLSSDELVSLRRLKGEFRFESHMNMCQNNAFQGFFLLYKQPFFESGVA